MDLELEEESRTIKVGDVGLATYRGSVAVSVIDREGQLPKSNRNYATTKLDADRARVLAAVLTVLADELDRKARARRDELVRLEAPQGR